MTRVAFSCKVAESHFFFAFFLCKRVALGTGFADIFLLGMNRSTVKDSESRTKGALFLVQIIINLVMI